MGITVINSSYKGESRCNIATEFGVNYDTLRKAINDGRLSDSTVELSNASTMSERSRIYALAALRNGYGLYANG